MPWHISHGGGTCGPTEWAVIKDSDGSTAGCHPSEEAAKKQMAALYANTPEAERAELKAATINDLPDSAFAYIEPGGKKDDQGKTVPRSKRHFPIHDAAHVRNALARAPQSPFGDRAMPKIRAAAKKFGIGEPAEAARADTLERLVFDRLWDVEDIIVRSGGDGRTVEAYAAVFDAPTEIKDQYGHYMEQIDRTAFNRTLSHGIGKVGVFFNHGMTIHGTPSDVHSVPVGRAVEIRPDSRGLLTVTRYNEGADGDRVLEAIRNGAIRGYSFRGAIIRSNPRKPPQARQGTSLPMWRHLELGLREYGPTPIPAYADAGIVAVRAALEEAQRQLQYLSPSTPLDPAGDTATPPMGPGAEDSPDGHSGRLHQRHLALKRAIRERGISKEKPNGA